MTMPHSTISETTAPWVGFDLDGTLAEYHGWVSDTHIGAPVPSMVSLVKDYLETELEVRIFTARADNASPEALAAIRDWCKTHIGQTLPITNVKDRHMIRLYDDRAVQVEINTGRLVEDYIPPWPRDFSRFEEFLTYQDAPPAQVLRGQYLRAAVLNETPISTCALASRLSHESWKRSNPDADRELLLRLQTQGDEHAKSIRGRVFFIALECTRYFWQEMDTYRVGTEPMGSTSTMFKEAKRLKGHELAMAKSRIPEGLLQLRVWMFSHQTLRRIVRQRNSHRLPEWQEICPWFDQITRL